MARRGFFAEIQHQAKVAAREAERREKERVREHNAAVREWERARKAEERAAAAAARAEEKERKRLEKEAKAAHAAAREAEVLKLNSHLEQLYEELGGLLAATLEVDDYVDLALLKREVVHPPFSMPGLQQPLPSIPEPTEPRKVGGLIGRKRRKLEAQAEADSLYAESLEAWQLDVANRVGEVDARPGTQEEAAQLQRNCLTSAENQYKEDCIAREREVVEHNSRVDKLIADLEYGVTDAIHEYLEIVLSNSVYPSSFEVEYDFEFRPSTAELELVAKLPPPADMPSTKAYKYKKSTDEITETTRTQKANKDLYSSVVHQVSLRTLHEVFEADRRGLIQSIALSVGTVAVDPATGHEGLKTFVAVAAEREAFLEIKLEAVVPEATLAHLGAAVSKNPFDLVTVSSSGIRKS